MTGIDQECLKLQQDIQYLLEQKRGLRKKERNNALRWQALMNEFRAGGPAGTAKGLAASLRHILPYYLYPSNVGAIEQVRWPFDYTFDFDFGTNPTLTATTSQSQIIEVTQEAAVIITSISFDGEDNSGASFRGPYQVNLIDNQSSRQLNERPIPVQAIGRRSNPTKLSTGYLVMPNSSITMEVNTWIPAGISVPTVGEGKMSFVVHGFRMRVDDFRSVLSATF